jgi:hypothetical protein
MSTSSQNAGVPARGLAKTPVAPAIGPRLSADDQMLEVEYRPEVILRSEDCIGLAHGERPKNDVAKRQWPLRIVAPLYSDLQAVPARFVEREVDVRRVNPSFSWLKARAGELSPGTSVNQKRAPDGLR